MGSIRRVLAVLATAVTVAAGLGVSSAPVQAAQVETPPCSWKPGMAGTDSGCDGLPYWDGITRYCGGSAQYPYGAIIRGPGGIPLASIDLGYWRGNRTATYPGGTCRVAFARIDGINPAATGCYVKVERTSDGQAYWASIQDFDFAAFTAAVYDAGVTSYAHGYCNYNGRGYTATTPSY